jgi:uncharacterized membrane protein HdeD (DUF308 family)
MTEPPNDDLLDTLASVDRKLTVLLGIEAVIAGLLALLAAASTAAAVIALARFRHHARPRAAIDT